MVNLPTTIICASRSNICLAIVQNVLNGTVFCEDLNLNQISRTPVRPSKGCCTTELSNTKIGQHEGVAYVAQST